MHHNQDNSQQRISWLSQRWRTQRNAIRSVNCRIPWIIKSLNAYCTRGFGQEYVCLSVGLISLPIHLWWTVRVDLAVSVGLNEFTLVHILGWLKWRASMQGPVKGRNWVGRSLLFSSCWLGTVLTHKQETKPYFLDLSSSEDTRWT